MLAPEISTRFPMSLRCNRSRMLGHRHKLSRICFDRSALWRGNLYRAFTQKFVTDHDASLKYRLPDPVSPASFNLHPVFFSVSPNDGRVRSTNSLSLSIAFSL